jgi:hypothetical protein
MALLLLGHELPERGLVVGDQPAGKVDRDVPDRRGERLADLGCRDPEVESRGSAARARRRTTSPPCATSTPFAPSAGMSTSASIEYARL